MTNLLTRIECGEPVEAQEVFDFVPNFRRRAEAVAATHGLTFKF